MKERGRKPRSILREVPVCFQTNRQEIKISASTELVCITLTQKLLQEVCQGENKQKIQCGLFAWQASCLSPLLSGRDEAVTWPLVQQASGMPISTGVGRRHISKNFPITFQDLAVQVVRAPCSRGTNLYH